MAKYSDGRKYRRRIGQRRKNFDIRDNLGSCFSSDLKDKEVQFIGDQGDNYYLTKHQRYKILGVVSDNWDFDRDIEERFKDIDYNKRRCIYDSSQHHGAMIVIVNDKGHKRRYYHNMFRLCEGSK